LTLDRVASRRSFLKIGAAALALGAVPAVANAGMIIAPNRRTLSGERSLKFDNLHTGEKLRTVYWQNGKYIPDSLQDVNHILRDFRNDETKPIDQDLLDLLNTLNRNLETDQPFQIISGYRSPETNTMLRSWSEGVASKSYHMRGMAIDIRVPGRDLLGLRRTAQEMQLGGVGYYPTSNFVHVDVGPVRTW
jgi:uncharacterized protein YcbK (DUF882 family)